MNREDFVRVETADQEVYFIRKTEITSVSFEQYYEDTTKSIIIRTTDVIRSRVTKINDTYVHTADEAFAAI